MNALMMAMLGVVANEGLGLELSGGVSGVSPR